MKKSHRIVGLVGVAIATVLATWLSVQIDWFPLLISPTDGKIDAIYEALLIGSVPFFVIIMAAIAFMLVEFRAKGEDDDRDGEPLHGNTMVEIIWTVIPTIVVIALGIYGWVVLVDVEAKQKNELTIDVTGQQFLWNFEYAKDEARPKDKFKTNEMVVPQGRPLQLLITSEDVIHSFYVPNARLKRDATAGVTKTLRFTPTVTGAFPIVCAELCGIGHTTMRQTLRVVKPAVFEEWRSNGGAFKAKPGGSDKQDTSAQDTSALGEQVFNAQGCAGCHTLAAANATGKVGPPLNTIRALGAAKIRQSIVAPNSVVAKGYSKGIMPLTFKDLPDDEIDALVAYLVKVGKQ